jgi:hypothetical protein
MWLAERKRISSSNPTPACIMLGRQAKLRERDLHRRRKGELMKPIGQWLRRFYGHLVFSSSFVVAALVAS